MQTPVEIKLLDRKFTVNCLATEKESLLQSAKFLNKQLTEMHGKSSSGSLMNSILKLALNLSYKLTIADANEQRIEFKLNMLNVLLEQQLKR